MLKMGFCMTYDNTSKITAVGACPFSHRDNINDMYVQLPADVNELNNFTCGRLKRRGLLCSNCEDSLGVAVLIVMNALNVWEIFMDGCSILHLP